MVFSSIVFLFLFLPPVLGVYYVLHAFAPRFWKHLFLTLCSYVFYGWSNPWFIWLMLASTGIDYVCARAMTDRFRSPRGTKLPLLETGGPRTRGQRGALIASLASNLALLGFFKYFNFGIDSWNALAIAMGADGLASDTTLRIVLPLGISFYTFQSMSYTIDVYRGDGRAIRSFPDFSCYVSMFPQLVAGPIIRFQEVADQIAERTHTLEKFARGVTFVCFGMAKKILLADTCGQVADVCFGAQHLTLIESWTGALAYAFQIYFDFSGYSDMAIGFGLMLGFMFAKNFDSPYRSASLSEFWRRWHLSLSNWLRDYLYIPLGGNRRGTRRTYANILTVMLLGGLWHGASWNFVLWGGLHGVALALERVVAPRPGVNRFARRLRIVATFIFVIFTWVPFRAPDLASTGRYWASMFGFGATDGTAGFVSATVGNLYLIGSVGIAAAVAFLGVQTWDFTRRLTLRRAALALALFLVALGLLAATSFHPFIYFIF